MTPSPVSDGGAHEHAPRRKGYPRIAGPISSGESADDSPSGLSTVQLAQREDDPREDHSLWAEHSRCRRQLELLSRASQQINAVLEVPVVMRSLVASALELVEADGGTSGVVVDGSMVVSEYHHKQEVEPLQVACSPAGQPGIPGWIMRERRCYITNDAASDAVIDPEMRRRYGISSALGLPILNRAGELIACLEVHNKRDGQPFGQEDITALEGLAAAAAVALENTKLYGQLSESEGRHRQLADNLPAGFIYQILQAADGSAQFVYVSGGIEALLGVTKEEVQADITVLYGLILEEDFPRVRAHEEEALRARKAFEHQFRTRTRDGSVRWLHCRSVPRALANGDTAWDGIAVDITQRMAMEQALRDADRRKDEFLAMLAHELRNPLAPLQNGLQILRLKCAGEPTIDEVGEMMQRQVGQLVRLVDDLLDISRITRGRVELRKELVDLAEVATRAVEAARPMIDARRHQLTYEGPPVPVLVNADPTRLTQVIGNLLNNAAKFTETGGRIRLSVGRELNAGVVRVVDEGIGIAADMLPRIFELFAQAERTLDRSQGGLGIGLTLVRHLVEIHGGSVQAFSAGLGTGSEFVVRLPAPAHLGPSDRFAVKRNAGGASPERILVVDDNVDAAESLAKLLRLSGHEASTAYTGMAVAGAVAEHRPDVVLLDIGLPGLDGYEVARRLRAAPGGDRLLLIALTGYGQESDRQRSRAAGFDHHLVKPLDVVALELLLGNQKGRGEE
jgi:PAS domain S-box-containing protein